MGSTRGFVFALLGLVVLVGWLVYPAQSIHHNYIFIARQYFLSKDREIHMSGSYQLPPVLKEKTFTKLCSTKSILTVNDSFPGPEIRVHKGDTVSVNIQNQGKYGLTIHWHGVKQPRNPWSDGPENITQCPIPVNHSFTQEIIFSDEEGTLWWHAHSDWTRATVHGPIIILPDPKPGYPHLEPDTEQTIVLGEWYKGDVMEIIDEALATGGDPNLSDAFTINGQPGDLYNCSSDTTFRMWVDQGKTYLLRIISAVMNEEIFFGIAKHNLTVVGMDGAYLKPITVSYIMIAPGQTMNVLVTANQSKSFYYMAGSPFADTNAPFDNTTTTAIFQYSGASPPASIDFPSLPAYNDKSAVQNFTKLLRSLNSPAHPAQVPVNITRRIFMTVSVNQIECPDSSCEGPNGNRLSASLNNISFVSPTIDVLHAYYRNMPGVYNATFPDEPPYYFNFTGDVGNNTLYPSLGTRAILVEYGDAVEIIFQGTNIGAAENHPMHLHGFSFYVVGMGDGNFDNMTSPNNYNLGDPPLVNTVGLPKNGWTTIRFVANNPGVWFMHCHLERHASWGMNTVLIVKNGGTSETDMLPPPPDMPQYCPWQ